MANIIEFEDKVDLIDSPEVPDNQKLKASEINKIRDLINEAYYRVRNLEINGAVGGDTVPVGTIMNFTGDGIQNGWLLCDGRAISRTEYSDLFEVIGTKYGEGDGTTTFNIPSGLEPIFYSSEASGVLKLKRYDPSFKAIIKAEQVVPITSEVVKDFKDASDLNAPSALLVKNSFSNPNLLINPDFRVWQRGTYFSDITSEKYYVDRWRVYGNVTSGSVNLKKVSNGVEISGGFTGSINLYQQVDKNEYAYLVGKKAMVTVCLNGVLQTYEKTFIDDNNSWIVLVSVNGLKSGDVLNYVKLELGDIATPFVPRSYGEELALCQRYGIKGLLQGDCLYRSSVNGNDMYFYLPTPVTLRTNPTFVGNLASTGSIAIRKKSDNTYIPIKNITCTADTNEIQVVCTLNSNVNGNPWEFMMYVYDFFESEIF